MNNMHLFKNRIHLQTEHTKQHNLLAEVEAKRLFLFGDQPVKQGNQVHDTPYHPCRKGDLQQQREGIILTRFTGNRFMLEINKVALKPNVPIKYCLMDQPKVYYEFTNRCWIIGTTKEKLIEMANNGTLDYELIPNPECINEISII